MIVIVESDEFSKLLVASERRCLMGDALHKVTVTGDEPRVAVNDGVPLAIEPGREVCFGDGHADRVCDSLSQRTGGRLNARGVAHLRMARCSASQLAELSEIIQ